VDEGTVGLVLADRRRAFAQGLALVLDATDGLAVLGLAHTCARTVEVATAHLPAVLLLDARLPGGDPVDTLAAVKAASPATKVLVLSADARPSLFAAATAGGADGLVTGHESSRQVVDAIHAVVAGRRVMAVGAEPPRAGGTRSMAAVRLGSLSCREREVLGLLAMGWSTRRIAEGLQVAECTVRSHVYNLLGKLNVHSRLEAAAFALEHQLAGGGMTPGEHPDTERS
jgi:two-component system, NarL family, nitrate/nitrite response regulator NarL